MLYIRTDANKHIAAGHVMRCLAIAAELRKQGEDTVFLVTEEEAAEIIRRFQFRSVLLGGAWNDLEKGMDELTGFIQSENIHKLLVDSYYASVHFFKILSSCVKLIYLGSLEKAFPGISLLINYSNTCNADFYAKAYHPQTVKLLGVKYAPLREEFRGLKPITREQVKNILITTGSSDENNITARLTEDLISLFPGLNYHLAAGGLNRNKRSLEELKARRRNVTLYFDSDAMAPLMRSCDVALSASGTTMYELCACGVPSVCFSITGEQDESGKTFGNNGVLFYAGNIADDYNACLQKIKYALERLINDFELRKNSAAKMNAYIDGNGCSRIAREIMKL